MSERPTRAQVAEEKTWNLEDYYPSREAWLARLSELEEQIPSVTAYKGKLHEGADRLLACLEAQEALYVGTQHAAAYSRLRLSEDGTSPVYQADSARMGDLVSRLEAALSFVRSEILSLPDGTVERFIDEEPGLAPFGRSLSLWLETKPYRLSAETEEVLASLGEVLQAPYTIYQRSKLSDMAFSPVVDSKGTERAVSFATYETEYEMSADTTLRRAAYRSFAKTLESYRNTFAAAYATEVKKQTILSRQRGYESAEHMLLQPQQVSYETYRSILDTIFVELAPIMRRYATLKKRVLGLDRMLFCDLKAPLDPEFSPPVDFAEAGRTVLSAIRIMGPEYAAIIEEALGNRWVDYADNIGKSTGAFCSSPYGSHSYIMMTWAGNMRSAFTLAHELGHAGHLMLAARNQRYSNFRPTMFFIEAPSTMNELLLAQHLMKESDDPRFKRWVILQLLNTYYHNFVTHLLEAQLQHRVYAAAAAGEALTANSLSAWKGAVLEEFWGDTVELDAGARLTWMRQPHYYMGLYPYTYSAGLTASTAAAALIREEGQPAVDRWLKVLKAGGTLPPLELMKLAGIDLSRPEPIRQAVGYVGSLVDELERLFA